MFCKIPCLSEILSLIILSFCFYLFVGLSEHNAHALDWHADVAQWTGVTPEAWCGVHTLHSGETRVKPALREKDDRSCAEAAEIDVFLKGLLPKSFLGLMTFVLLWDRSCWKVYGLQGGGEYKQEKTDAQTNTTFVVFYIFKTSTFNQHLYHFHIQTKSVENLSSSCIF